VISIGRLEDPSRIPAIKSIFDEAGIRYAIRHERALAGGQFPGINPFAGAQEIVVSAVDADRARVALGQGVTQSTAEESSDGEDLEWIQTGSRPEQFELRGAGIVLTFKREFWIRRYRATAQTSEGLWEFRRRAWLDDTIVVRDPRTDETLATLYVSGARAGTLLRGEGPERLTALTWSGCTWDTEEDWMIRYHNSSGPRTMQAKLEVDRRIAHLPELRLLITLGWYMQVADHHRHRG
jgi:hypothetical protein